jgi:hypothetical protein
MRYNNRTNKGLTGTPTQIEPQPGRTSTGKISRYEQLLRKKSRQPLSPQEHANLITLAGKLGKLTKKEAGRILKKLQAHTR